MLTNHLPAQKETQQSAPSLTRTRRRNAFLYSGSAAPATLGATGIHVASKGEAVKVFSIARLGRDRVKAEHWRISFFLSLAHLTRVAREGGERTAVCKFEGEDAALVQVELILVGLGVVEHFHVAALHAHC